MHTVRTLSAVLAGYPDDLPVAAVVAERVGWYAEQSAAGVDHLDVALDDTGAPSRLWLIASSPTPDPPAILRVRCRCGVAVLVDDTNPVARQPMSPATSFRPAPG